MAAAYGIEAPDYRLPEDTHVGRVRLQVSDLSRSIEYYQSVIGLRVQDRTAGAAVLGPQDDESALVELHERAGAGRVPANGRLGLYHFAILVPGRGTLGAFVAHLIDSAVRLASADHLVSEAIYLWDPDGLGIEVYADRARAQWRTNGRELAMATEALDLRDLVRAAGDDPWIGLPRGTVMGHVHLHVGDLERAEALYHAALGFDKTVWSYPGALFLSAGGYHHHLGTNTWARGAPAASDDEARLLDWELVLPGSGEVERVARRAAERGFEVAVDGADRIVSDDWGTRCRLTTGRLTGRS